MTCEPGRKRAGNEFSLSVTVYEKGDSSLLPSTLLPAMKDVLEKRMLAIFDNLLSLDLLDYNGGGEVKKTIVISAGVGACALLALAVAVVLIARRWLRHSRRSKQWRYRYLEHASTRKRDTHGMQVCSPEATGRTSRNVSWKSKQPSLRPHQITEDKLEEITDFSCVLGNGSGSCVYAGHLDGKDVAVKVMSGDVRMHNQGGFVPDVMFLPTARHANVVAYFAKCDSRHAVIMELVEGDSLANRLAHKPLPWQALVDILYSASKGLQFLHESVPQVLHHDIRPQNILLTGDLSAKLSDVGLGYRFPSPDYADPSYIITGNFKPSSDVYAYGMTLLKVLTNR